MRNKHTPQHKTREQMNEYYNVVYECTRNREPIASHEKHINGDKVLSPQEMRQDKRHKTRQHTTQDRSK